MELRHLRAFVAAADAGHFGEAAASLNLTQPGLSLRIQALERELGAQLLDRNAREVRLTALGNVLLPYAKSLVGTADSAIADLRQHAAANAGQLRISYLTLWEGLPTSIVSAFKVRYPATSVDSASGYSQVNLDRVVKRDIDLAFLTMGAEGADGVLMRPIERHEIVLALNPTHRLAALDLVPVSELRGEPVIALSPGVNNAIARAEIKWLARHLGEDPNVVAYEPPDQLAGAVAHRRNAVTLLTKVRAAAAAASGIVYRRLSPSPMLEYGIAFRKDNKSTTLAHLLEIVDELATPLARDLSPEYEILANDSDTGVNPATPSPLAAS